MPREMEFDKLIQVLLDEHRQMKAELEKVEAATLERNFPRASEHLRELESIFKRHIEDEEAQVIRLLIGSLGRDGAAEEIKVFQQHRPIYALMQQVSRLSSLATQELESEEASLRKLFDDHTAAEEGRVFPRALGCYRRPS